MNRALFLATLRRVGMTQLTFAASVGVHKATVYHWGGAGGPFPKWVELLLAAWARNQELETTLKLFERRTPIS